MKKLITVGVTLLAALSLAACGSSTSSKDSSSSKTKTEKAKKVDSSIESSKKAASASKASSKKADAESIPTTPDKPWFYSAAKNVFYAGNETMTFTKSEVRDGYDTGSKVLCVYVTILNNSKEEMDPSNFDMVLTAKQKTDTSNVTLDPGTLKGDENGNDPLQSLEDNYNNSLLPGKTIQAVLLYKLQNTNPVSLEMSNENMDVIGTRTIDVK